MKKVFRSNTYLLIVLLLQLFLPIHLIFKSLNITDIRVVLLLNHTMLFIVPAILYLIFTKQSPKKVLKLNKLYLKDSLWLILLAVVCQPIMMFFSLISQFFFENEIGNFIVNIMDTPYIVLLLLVAVMPAITEEITIRGIVLSGYEKINVYLACCVTGLLFGIMHLDPQQFLYATVLGFILALVVRITNSIFAASIIHFIVNGTSVTLSKLVSLVSTSSTVMEQASEMSLKVMPTAMKIFVSMFYGCVAIAFGIVVYFILKKLVSLNVRRGIITYEDMSLKKSNIESKENVFNLPFIAIIITYILVMIRNIII